MTDGNKKMLTREAKRTLDTFKPKFAKSESSSEFDRVWRENSNAIIESLKEHIKPLPKVLRQARKYLKPNFSSVREARVKSEARVDSFLKWAKNKKGSVESLLDTYESLSRVSFTVSELEIIVSHLDKIAGIPKSKWEYQREANAFTLSFDEAPNLKTGIRRGEGGKLWNVSLRNIDGEKTYFASIIPERNTVIAKKSEEADIEETKPEEEEKPEEVEKTEEKDMDTKEFAEGWKYASRNNDVPEFTVTSSFLRGYLAYAEMQLEDADTHEVLDQPLPGRDDLVDYEEEAVDTHEEKNDAYKNRADDLNSRGNDDVLEQGFVQDK